MAKSQKTVPAGEFKARCLALLDQVAETGKPLVVTKRGKPVARVVPVAQPPGLLHSVKKEKDLISPIGEKWDASSISRVSARNASGPGLTVRLLSRCEPRRQVRLPLAAMSEEQGRQQLLPH